MSKVLNTLNISLLSGKPYKTKRLFVLVLCLISIGLTALAAPADLDPTFGDGGKVVSSPDGSNMSFSSAMALQSDGKIVRVGGIIPIVAGGMIVARYNTDGSLDMTFGNKGWTALTFGGDREIAQAVAIQTDGKIVVGGYTFLNSLQDTGIARFNPDGSLDTTFSEDGKTTVDFGAPDYIDVLKIANDGKIVFGGSAAGQGTASYRNTLGRLNSDGSLDTTFAEDGKILGSNGGGQIHDLIVQPDGSIVTAVAVSNQFSSLMIARKYNSDGSDSWTYSHYQDLGIYIGLYGITAQPDGKIILVGTRFGKVTTTRLNQSGSEDAQFNQSTETPDGRGISVAVQPDGKIVTSAFIETVEGNGKYSMIRYNADGSLDVGFGNGGIIYTDVTNGGDAAQKVLIQSDGKILAGGSSFVNGEPGGYRFSMVRYQGGNFVSDNPAFDYDGDGKSDISVYRPSNGVWYLNQSTNGFTAAQFGIASDRIVPADFDGDGKTDIAIYRDGFWWILESGTNTFKVLQFGIAEDKPQTGDFDGDGKDDLVVYRPTEGVWYVFRSSNSSYYAIPFGVSEDIPVVADYDGDGIADIAVYRPSSGVWYVQKSLGGISVVAFGLSDDIPTANDFDGDGNADIAVWRPSNGDWYVLRSSNGQVDRTQFGQTGDIPVAADYDGDSKTDIAIFRPSNGVWYQKLSTQGNSQQVFGGGGDRPTPNAYNP